ncbi:DDE-type integrase/transposase/recombinase [Gemmatimonas sp.]|uniref:DDE-type integrase/transposase/recombinase n=1 Tax=Gemmatimonas sp. TaxID=1962908 RepID=UPI0037C030C2
MDWFSRTVVGWTAGPTIHGDRVVNALASAAKQRRPRGTIIHSDQTVQFGSDAWRRFCRANHLGPSMSRTGNCRDNAVVESFFCSVKQERNRQRVYPNLTLRSRISPTTSIRSPLTPVGTVTVAASARRVWDTPQAGATSCACISGAPDLPRRGDLRELHHDRRHGRIAEEGVRESVPAPPARSTAAAQRHARPTNALP